MDDEFDLLSRLATVWRLMMQSTPVYCVIIPVLKIAFCVAPRASVCRSLQSLGCALVFAMIRDLSSDHHMDLTSSCEIK